MTAAAVLNRCQCGCSSEISLYDSRGRPRRFVQGHNARGPLYTPLRLIECACGCGTKLTNKNKFGGMRGRIQGHGAKLKRRYLFMQCAACGADVWQGDRCVLPWCKKCRNIARTLFGCPSYLICEPALFKAANEAIRSRLKQRKLTRRIADTQKAVWPSRRKLFNA